MNTTMKRIGMTLLTLTMMTGMFAAANAETVNTAKTAGTQPAVVTEMTEAKRDQFGFKVGCPIYAECTVPVRSAPNRSAKQLTAIPRGGKATYKGGSAYDERGQIWYKVKYNGVTGWVSSRNTHLG